MSNDRFYADIKELLDRNGAMGVNQLAKALDVPLSTLQKYLDKDQNYFKKNNARKWILPDDSAISDMTEVSANYGSIIDSQLLSMNALIETLMSQFRATVTLIETRKPVLPSVAGISPKVDKRLIVVMDEEKKLKEAFKKKKENIPEEYRDLLLNFDYVGYILERGQLSINIDIIDDVYELVLGKTEILSENTLVNLEKYQK